MPVSKNTSEADTNWTQPVHNPTHHKASKHIRPHAQLLALLKHLCQITRAHPRSTDLEFKQLDLTTNTVDPLDLSRSEGPKLLRQLGPLVVVGGLGLEDLFLQLEMHEAGLEAGLDRPVEDDRVKRLRKQDDDARESDRHEACGGDEELSLRHGLV
jgi:hypothetical protein